jgi:hypothetical protein
MRWVTFLHPFFHKAGVMEACWLCRYVWRQLLKDPDFVADLDQGLADFKAGRVHKWSDVRRDL